MWHWALLGWLLASIGAAAVHHRLRKAQPQQISDIAAFVLRLEAILAEHHPEVRFAGMLPDQFACVIEVDGQETPVALRDAFRHEQAFPDAFPDFVARLLEEIRDIGLDRIEDLDLAFAAPQLLPQVRSRAWLDEKGCFGDSGLVHRRINDELVSVYVIDDPHCMVFLCRAHLKRWRKSEDDVHNLAVANLVRLDPSRRDQLRAIVEPMRVDAGDGYDAARLLLLGQTDGLLVSVPDRDVLWVGNEGEVGLESLMADTREIAEQSTHPISGKVFRVNAGRIEVVPAEPQS